MASGTSSTWRTRRARQRRVLHDRDLAGELREQPDGAGDDVVEVDRAVQEGLDRAALGRRQRLDRRRAGRRTAGSPCRWGSGRRWCAAGRCSPRPRARPCRCGSWRARRRGCAARPAPWTRPARGWTRSPRRSRAARRACGPPARAPPGGPATTVWHSRQQSASVRRTAGLTAFPACPAAATGRPADRVVAVDRYSATCSPPAGAAGARRRPGWRPSADLVVEDVETGFCGAVVRTEKTTGGLTVTLEDRHGRHRVFPLGSGFLVDGSPVELVRPAQPAAPAAARRTASGSVAVPGARGPGRPRQPDLRRGQARRRAGREGLGRRPAGRGRRGRAPGRHRRPARRGPRVRPRPGTAGSACSSTTWSPGSKESRLAAQVVLAARAGRRPPVRRRLAGGPAGRAGDRRLAGGAPRDAVEGGRLRRPGLAGRPARGLAADPRRRPVYADLEPSLLGRVEELIDFVTHGDAGP